MRQSCHYWNGVTAIFLFNILVAIFFLIVFLFFKRVYVYYINILKREVNDTELWYIRNKQAAARANLFDKIFDDLENQNNLKWYLHSATLNVSTSLKTKKLASQWTASTNARQYENITPLCKPMTFTVYQGLN